MGSKNGVGNIQLPVIIQVSAVLTGIRSGKKQDVQKQGRVFAAKNAIAALVGPLSSSLSG